MPQDVRPLPIQRQRAAEPSPPPPTPLKPLDREAALAAELAEAFGRIRRRL